jgi:thiol:disulfide interchange protein DsbA
VKNVFSEEMKPAKVIFNITLALISMGIIVFDYFCRGTCSYISGDLFGIDLRYFGLAFMALIIALSFFKKSRELAMVLSAGMGIEIYLVGFQVWFNTYCPYCLAFGGFLMILFFMNIRRTTLKTAALCALSCLILFALFFQGSFTPAFAAETLVPSFGTGKIKVRIYTDYFCPPCRALEPQIEPLLTELVKRNIINLTFVDTPFSKYTPLYTRYLLYALNEKKTLEQALWTRSILIGASFENITDQEKLEEVLKNKGVKLKPFEVKPTFEILNSYLSGDKIRSTPTCVIVQEGKTNHYTSEEEIISALRRLKP